MSQRKELGTYQYDNTLPCFPEIIVFYYVDDMLSYIGTFPSVTLKGIRNQILVVVNTFVSNQFFAEFLCT